MARDNTLELKATIKSFFEQLDLVIGSRPDLLIPIKFFHFQKIRETSLSIFTLEATLRKVNV
jgi:hypothetical protein